MDESVDSSELNKIALEQGLINLKTNGSKLVRQGITSPFEVMRVLG